jgi:cysteine desulfurase
MQTQTIYLDHAATTPVAPGVLTAMRRCERELYGNASSVHSAGVRASRELERARGTISAAIGAEPDEIYFTSGGTESNNLALSGVVLAALRAGGRPHFIISEIEHPSVWDTARWLATQGASLTVVGVDRQGRVDPAAIEHAIQPDTVLVSIMHGSNELGTVQSIGDIGAVCRSRGVLFHSDACQSFTRVPINVRTQQVDLLSINAHKIYGPKGVGAIFIRRKVRLAPLFHGGGQESGVRSGTVNTPGVCGFGAAVTLAAETEPKTIATLRDRLISRVVETISGSFLNGSATDRLSNHVSISIPGTEARKLLLALSARGIYVSTGAACASGKREPSRALLAIGLSPDEAIATLRMSLGRQTRARHIETVVTTLATLVAEQRRLGLASSANPLPAEGHG